MFVLREKVYLHNTMLQNMCFPPRELQKRKQIKLQIYKGEGAWNIPSVLQYLPWCVWSKSMQDWQIMKCIYTVHNVKYSTSHKRLSSQSSIQVWGSISYPALPYYSTHHVILHLNNVCGPNLYTVWSYCTYKSVVNHVQRWSPDKRPCHNLMQGQYPSIKVACLLYNTVLSLSSRHLSSPLFCFLFYIRSLFITK